jgi:hypothetical protein
LYTEPPEIADEFLSQEKPLGLARALQNRYRRVAPDAAAMMERADVHAR